MELPWLIITVFALGHGDELVHNKVIKEDKVQRQYLEFPYPPPPDLRAEKIYYGNGFQFQHFSPTIVLEELNHHLYQGKRDFRSENISLCDPFWELSPPFSPHHVGQQNLQISAVVLHKCTFVV